MSLAKRTIGPVEPAGNVLARRRIGPADETARTALIHERLDTITGRQQVIAACWRCGAAYDAADTDRYETESDGWYVCAGPERNECDERAVRAKRVCVLGTPGGGDAG